MTLDTNITELQAQLLADFLAVAEVNDFATITTIHEVPACGVWLADGTDIPCLAVAYDDVLDAWTTLDRDGHVRQFISGEVF